MRWPVGTAGLCVGVTVLSGCGGSAPSATPTATVTVTVTAQPTPVETADATPSAAFSGPNVGTNALKIGETRHGADVDTTVLGVKRPMVSSNSGRTPDEAGQEWVGVDAKSCLHADSGGKNEIAWTDYVAIDNDGGTYQASSSSWTDWPSPQYPTAGTVLAGQCRSGWLLIPVPKGVKLAAIELAPPDEDGYASAVADWKIPPA